MKVESLKAAMKDRIRAKLAPKEPVLEPAVEQTGEPTAGHMDEQQTLDLPAGVPSPHPIL